MATGFDIITAALRHLGVLQAGEDLAGEDGADGLVLLNDMLRGFRADGIAYTHVELAALADEIAVPGELVLHLQFVFAVYIASQYSVTPTATVLAAGENGRKQLQVFYALSGRVADGSVGDFIRGALRLIVQRSLSPEEVLAALIALNEMLHGFMADGIAYSHTTMTDATAAFPFPAQEVGHVRYMFAVWIAPEYGSAPSPLVIDRADNGRRYLQGKYKIPKTARVDSGLLHRRPGTMTLSEWERG